MDPYNAAKPVVPIVRIRDGVKGGGIVTVKNHTRCSNEGYVPKTLSEMFEQDMWSANQLYTVALGAIMKVDESCLKNSSLCHPSDGSFLEIEEDSALC